MPFFIECSGNSEKTLCFASSTQGNRQAGPEHDMVGSHWWWGSHAGKGCSLAPANPAPWCVSSSVPQRQEPITGIKTNSLEDPLPWWLTGHSLSMLQVEIRRCTETVHAGKNLMHLTQNLHESLQYKITDLFNSHFYYKKAITYDIVPNKLDNQAS